MILRGSVILLLLIFLNKQVIGYKIGVGRADCTGPPVEISFMGYAQLSQKGQGIHLRQFARSFIIDNNGRRVVFVVADAAMMGHEVKREIVSRLQKKYGKELYSMENIIISGTHTHGTPGGFLMDLLYDLTSLGFVSETFNALINGIFNSIDRAHNNIIDGRIFISDTDILDVNINRSPTAYLNNPSEERAQFKDNVDKKLTQIKFVDTKNEVIGAINWYAVHPTSMNNTNRLVTSDNLGYAAMMLEKERNPYNLPGKGKFVGAFASSNLGDVSPNIMGPKCQKTGEPCDLLTSSCPKEHGLCFSSGPGRDMYESTQIIATRLYNGASKLLKSSNSREITGKVRFIHQFIDMPKAKASYFNPKTRNSENVRGCLPAMGYSFAAGTTDGPGAFDFRQGTKTDNSLWNAVRDFIAEPTEDDKECQFPKPILIETGRAIYPYEWQPKIVPTQIVQIGDVVLAAVPGEFTTMAGRRLRSGIRNAYLQAGGNEVQVIVSGLSNHYTSYITTPEEYEVQRYEGASTIFGPHTLTIYIDQFQKLAQSLVKNDNIEPGPNPPYLDGNVLSLNTGVIYDGHPYELDFGTVKTQPHPKYLTGERVVAKFVAANPRNNILHDKTYLTIEKINSEGNWTIVATDASWETQFRWERVSTILGFSDVDVIWNIPEDTEPGSYRIRHFGNYRYILGGVYPYDGTSRIFEVEK